MGFPLSDTTAAQYVRPTVGPLERLKALVSGLFSHKFQCVTHRIHARFVQLVYRLLSVGVYGINDLPVKQPCRWREHIVLQKAHSLAAVFSRLQLLFAVNIAAASKMCSHVSYPMSVMLNHSLVAFAHNLFFDHRLCFPDVLKAAQVLQVFYALSVYSHMVVAKVLLLRSDIAQIVESEFRIVLLLLFIPSAPVLLLLFRSVAWEYAVAPFYSPTVVSSYLYTTIGELHFVARSEGIVESHVVHN